MAKSRKSKRSRRKPRQSGGRKKPQKSGKDAMKGMAIGMGLMVLVAVFVFVKIGDQTLFNRVANAIGAFAGDDEAESDKTGETGKTSTAPARSRAKPEMARNQKTAKPLEKLSPNDQRGLDALIDKRSKK